LLFQTQTLKMDSPITVKVICKLFIIWYTSKRRRNVQKKIDQVFFGLEKCLVMCFVHQLQIEGQKMACIIIWTSVVHNLVICFKFLLKKHFRKLNKLTWNKRKGFFPVKNPCRKKFIKSQFLSVYYKNTIMQYLHRAYRLFDLRILYAWTVPPGL